MRAVDPLLPEQRLERAALPARQRRVRRLHDAKLFRGGEPPPRLLRHRLLRGTVQARGLILLDWLGHVRPSILRPSLQRYPGGAVSADVGTEGSARSERPPTRSSRRCPSLAQP